MAKRPLPQLTSAGITKLRNELRLASGAYHNGSKLLMTDQAYDRKVDILEYNSPNDPFLDEVGAPVTGGKKVTLPFAMPSLSKVRTGRGLEKFLQQSSGRIVASIKLDGSSLMYIDINGKKYLFTRGNGSIGRDVSFLIPHLKGLGKLNRNQAVRGEAMIPESRYVEFWQNHAKKKFANSRALVNGAINSSKVHDTIADIEFIAHSSVNPAIPWEKARVKLKGQGFNTVPTVIIRNPTPAQLTKFLSTAKRDNDYTLDGLVIEDAVTNRPVSFKVDEEGVEVLVRSVRWDISRYEVYKPTVLIEPTKIGGVTVSKVTGHNAAFIITNKIGPGAVLEVIRSGDVIPKIIGTVKGVKPQLPAEYEWNATKTDIHPVELTEADETRLIAKRLAESLKILKIEGARLQSMLKLSEEGFDDLYDLYAASAKDFVDAGLGNVVSRNLYSDLSASKNTITHGQLMAASHFWPRGFSVDKFDLILNVIPYRSLMKLSTLKLRQKIAAIHGLSVATANVFIKHLDDYENFLDDLGWMPKSPLSRKPGTKGDLEGKAFCFTKIRDKAVEAAIIARGGSIANSVSKTTTALVVRSKLESSTKSERAETLGVPIFELRAFVARYKIKV